MIALVFLVIFFTIDSGSIVKSSFKISTKTGFAPVDAIAFALATNVKDGTITSSPFLISNAYSAACNAAVPEFTAIAYLILT